MKEWICDYLGLDTNVFMNDEAMKKFLRLLLKGKDDEVEEILNEYF